MNKERLINARETGETVADVAVALIAIIQSLKKQPGFDSKLFDDAIKEIISRKPDEDSLTNKILNLCLTPEKD